MLPKNLLMNTDVYKIGHLEFYPEGTTKIYSYLCARSNKKSDKTLFFGLQYYIKEYLQTSITKENVEEFLDMYRNVLGKEPSDFVKNRMNSLAELGYLPISIKAIPEGTVVENKNVLATVTNTHPDFAWVVGYLESLLLKVWNTCSVATYSKKLVDTFRERAIKTSDSDFLVPFQVHDFGYRGVSSEETAIVSGMSHLISSLGTDTIPAIRGAKYYYKATEPVGLSVPATEHSVMCSYGQNDEIGAFKRMLQLNPTGIVSIVSDTYNLWNVLTNFTQELKENILARDGKVVFRPDSGDPKLIICGNPNAEKNSPENKGVIRLLDEQFGSTVNSKGFKELSPKVGMIYGDGMYYERIVDILNTLESMGYASTNLVIGVGGLLLQQHNRDDLGFAFKATFAEVNGEIRELFKDPITDKKKQSHKGLMALFQRKDGSFYTLDQRTEQEEKEGLLQEVYRNGILLKEVTFDEIRGRAKV